MWTVITDLDLDVTHSVSAIRAVSVPPTLNSLCLVYDDILVNCHLHDLFSLYHMWHARDLKQLAKLHNMRLLARDTSPLIIDKLLEHECNRSCTHYIVAFTTLRAPRTAQQLARPRPCPRSMVPLSPNTYLRVVDEALRRSIIRDWQQTLSTDTIRPIPCAVCARRTPQVDIVTVRPSDIDLTLLRNDALPPCTLPTTYAFDLYERALLYPKAMSDPWSLAPFQICVRCRTELVDRQRMPKLSLANWLYYAHDELPNDVARAFSSSTHVERSLISRARSTRISFRFNQAGDDNDNDDGQPDTSPNGKPLPQRYVKGNVLIMPQNSTQLNTVLPPSPSIVHDTICALFVGREPPTRATLKKIPPLLARKSTVATLIAFLVKNNPYYAANNVSFFGLSRANLDALFPSVPGADEIDVPSSMEIGFVRDNDAFRATTSDYTHRDEDAGSALEQDSLLMENVGYTSGDNSPLSYREMKMRALSHCLNGHRFLWSKPGDRFVPDFHNPELLTWLFPHLDPWGLGGFHHPSRIVNISMEDQLKYLLELDDPRFERDADFAFVYYNILQKKSVCDSVRFRVKLARQEETIASLLAVNQPVLQRMISAYKKDPAYNPTEPEEQSILRLIDSVAAVLPNLPGTTAHKLTMRNEIRSLVNFHGTPAFFVTLNPSDIHHPLVRLLSGDDIRLEDAAVGEELNSWERKLLVARNPGACAKFFDIIITHFINVVLRYGKRDNGLFGKCIAYYGTVEAQARGTLHCHFLIWIEGHPSPQQMRDMMIESEDYKNHLFKWLESLIKSELLGTTAVVVEPPGEPLRRPRFRESVGSVHPGVQPAPRIADLLPSEFQAQYNTFVNELVRNYNWHEHTHTCWKYLRRNQLPSDATCRMRIDGSTHPHTTIDPDTLSIQLRRLHPRIANYNDLIIFLIQANMDIKHIGSGEGAKALIYYITDYITKSALPTHLGLAALMYALSSTNFKYGDANQWTSRETSGALTILINSMISRQEVSHQQVMSYLVGGGDHYTSHRYRLIYYMSFDRMVRAYWENQPSSVDVQLLSDTPIPATAQTTHEQRPCSTNNFMHLPVTSSPTMATIPISTSNPHVDNGEQSVTLCLADGSISAINQQQDYLLRPSTETFENIALYEFVGLTEKLPSSSDSRRLHDSPSHDTGRRNPGRPRLERGQFLVGHPDRDTHIIRRRSIWLIPVVLGPHIPRPDRTEQERNDWSRVILLLFIPWRTPADLKRRDESWYDAYMRQKDRIPPLHQSIIHNMGVLSECRDARDRARHERHLLANAPVGACEAQPTPNRANDDDLYSPEDDIAPDPSLLDPTAPYLFETSPTSITEVIDSIISLPARVAVDQCFTRSNTGLPNFSFGSATEVSTAELAALEAEKKSMQSLKRKRRPEPISAPPILPRRTRRRKRSLTPQPATLLATSLPSSDPEASQAFSSHRQQSPPQEDLQDAIDQVIVEFHLTDNDDQLRAFEIAANHICFGGPQLLMYIGGVGGTGKSYVVNAILHLFQLLDRRNQVLVSAPTGAAAILIGGFTIHSLLLLPRRDNPDLQMLALLWEGVYYLIIDEVSMISANLLYDICTRLQQVKGQAAIAEDRPFGGINVIFLGDFGQLKPVKGASLYSYRFIDKLSPQDATKQSAQEAFKGVFLWRSITTVVLLHKNQRQQTDPAYSELLARVRKGQSGDARYNKTAFDTRTLQKRLVQNFDPASCASFVDAPIIVGRKEVRDPLNYRLLHLHAAGIGAEVNTYYSIDKVDRKVLEGPERDTVWNLSFGAARNSLSRLPLFPGMKVMIQENIAFAHNVVNGAVGTVRDIKYDQHLGYRTISVVYVEIPGAGRLIGQAHDDIIPVFPAPTYFSWNKPSSSPGTREESVSVTRIQPPILPAYVYTDYKAQGRSLDNAIVDLASSMSTQGAYVMLSRVRTLNGLAVLRPFRASKIETPISGELRNELLRLEKEHNTTAAAHRHRLYYQT